MSARPRQQQSETVRPQRLQTTADEPQHRRLRLLGVPIRLHWTFSLLILAILFAQRFFGAGWFETLVTVGFVLVLFACGSLHQLARPDYRLRRSQGERDYCPDHSAAFPAGNPRRSLSSVCANGEQRVPGGRYIEGRFVDLLREQTRRQSSIFMGFSRSAALLML